MSFDLMGSRFAPLLAVLLFGCGSADQTRTARDEEPETSIEPYVNICPRFHGALVVPKTLPLGEYAVVVAIAEDPDAPHATLRYQWSASSGELSNPDGANTEYRCSEVGDQLLSLVARDELDCAAQIDIEMYCLER
ncbi:MAG TPA: hypothetical protein VJN18_24945 [Polyangiaceae bacterium]|nr:hypothetical protein [Polyangiaceae bacterium]